MKNRHIFAFASIFIVSIFLVACGSSGGGGGGVGPAGSADNDSDGIPNSDDAFPDDANRFASLTETALDPFDAATSFSAAVAANNDGQAVGTSNSPSGVHAVMWNTVTGDVTELAAISGETFASAADINSNGDAVGTSAANSGANFVAVSWASGTGVLTELANLPSGTDSAAHGIDDSGRIVGEADDDTGSKRAVYWADTASAPVMLTDTLGSIGSSATAIASGFVAGYATDAAGLAHAVLWILDAAGAQIGFTDLGMPAGATGAMASSVNAAGFILGEYEDATGTAHSIQWQVDGSGVLIAGPSDLLDPLLESSGLAVNGAANARGAGWVEDAATSNITAYIADFRFTGNGQSIFDPATVMFSEAFDINDNDLLVGIKQTANGNEAFAASSQ